MTEGQQHSTWAGEHAMGKVGSRRQGQAPRLNPTSPRDKLPAPLGRKRFGVIRRRATNYKVQQPTSFFVDRISSPTAWSSCPCNNHTHALMVNVSGRASRFLHAR